MLPKDLDQKEKKASNKGGKKPIPKMVKYYVVTTGIYFHD